MSAAVDLEPFGTPEGGRADLQQIRDEFVEFSSGQGSSGLALAESDLSARVIVGKKGAGKTVYLRRAQAFATDADNLYADDSPHQPPATAQIVKVGDMHAGGPAASETLVEAWAGIWKAAILRSLVSQMAHNEHLADPPVTREIAQAIWRDYAGLCPPERDQLSVYSQVRAIIETYSEVNDLSAYLGHPHWDAVERRVGNALQHCRPVCFYLDAIDEEYRHAPHYWLVCQKGLFYQVMRFLRDQRLGGRLHVLICIRDHVYSSILQSEHLTRYLSRRHIRKLDWDWPTIEYLLARKIERLDHVHLLSPGADDPVESWLGISVVRNEVKQCDESVCDYLIRHTRLIPRDLVIVCNMLAARVQGARARGAKSLRSEEVVATVRNAALLFGQEQLAICGNHLASESMPAHAARWQISELYTGQVSEMDRRQMEADWGGIHFDPNADTYGYHGLEDYDGDDPGLQAQAHYQLNMLESLKRLLRSLGDDRFDRLRFLQFRGKAGEFFRESDVTSVLWQSGMLGYLEDDLLEGQPVFFGDISVDPLSIPADKPAYAVHPCLIDCVPLAGIGRPVLPHKAQR